MPHKSYRRPTSAPVSRERGHPARGGCEAKQVDGGLEIAVGAAFRATVTGRSSSRCGGLGQPHKICQLEKGRQVRHHGSACKLASVLDEWLELGDKRPSPITSAPGTSKFFDWLDERSGYSNVADWSRERRDGNYSESECTNVVPFDGTADERALNVNLL